MCGIAGLWAYNNQNILDPRLIKSMVERIAHRGPDDAGFLLQGDARQSFDRNWNGESPGRARVVLGHARLSILDLSPAGHQPMSVGNGKYWIVFNGEVYNYREIKTELEAAGYVFHSGTDTEVILNAYAKWGEECLPRFNGMFAFVIWDTEKNQLFAARDRFGIKPFYYWNTREKFAFASEIKALLTIPGLTPVPNNDVILTFVATALFDNSEQTFFKNVLQLPPGYALRVTSEGAKTWSWWDFDPAQKRTFSRKEKAQIEFLELFEDAVRLRLRSDVPVGSCLSGGLDSSTIVVVANDLLRKECSNFSQNAFSSCFGEKKYDEQEYIDEVVRATGVHCHKVFPDLDNLFSGDLDKLVWHQEEPFGGTSIYAQWNVMKTAREKSVPVLLDGQGADEMMGGYPMFFISWFEDLKRVGDPRLAAEQEAYAKYHIGNFVHNQVSLNPNLVFTQDFLREHNKIVPATRQKGGMPDHLTASMYQSFIMNVPGLLHYEDRNSMAHSIETRLPFLDYRLVEFCFSLPSDYKLGGGLTKLMLRLAMQGILPEKIRMRTDKMGFVTPEDQWLRTSARERLVELFTSPQFKARGIFNGDYVASEFLKTHVTEGKNMATSVWRIASVEYWFRKFIDSNK